MTPKTTPIFKNSSFNYNYRCGSDKNKLLNKLMKQVFMKYNFPKKK